MQSIFKRQNCRKHDAPDLDDLPYDEAYVWPLLDDVMIGAIKARHLICGEKTSYLPVDAIMAADKKKVLLVGSYWSLGTLKTLQQQATSVSIVVYSEKDMDTYSGFCGSITTIHGIFSPQEEERYPWLKLLWGRNRKDSKDPEERAFRKKQEHFYRGLLDYGKEHDYDEVSDLITALCRQELSLNYDQLEMYGRCVARSQKLAAIFDVSRHSVTFTHSFPKGDGEEVSYSLCVIMGGPSPVMPLAKAAAKQADIGVNVRSYGRENLTRFTFYTYNPKVDMSFVRYKPLGGGGENNCRGANVKGFFESIDKVIEFISSVKPE